MKKAMAIVLMAVMCFPLCACESREAREARKAREAADQLTRNYEDVVKRNEEFRRDWENYNNAQARLNSLK